MAIRWWLLLLVELLAMVGRAPTAFAQQVSTAVLWDRSITPYLRRELWRTGERYYATNYLMVPLHAAFQQDHRQWELEFSEHFQRFLAEGPTITLSDTTELGWLQYSYLLSEFLSLAARAGRVELISRNAHTLLCSLLQQEWTVRPASRVGGNSFKGGMRERIIWKLQSPPLRHRDYARAITDHERLVFAIAADLRSYEIATHTRVSLCDQLDDILAVAARVFHERVVVLPSGGWLFQPGIWSGHPDFAYAGLLSANEASKTAPLKDVAEDVSHSQRLPLLLTSLALAAPPNSASRQYYLGLRRGLARQFTDRVLVRPDATFVYFRTTNYMDGRNGLYRWHSQYRGYGPYALSTTFTLGWWAFLGDATVTKAYRSFATYFEQSANIDAYFYPHGAPPSGTVDTSGTNWRALRLLLVRLASDIRPEADAAE